MNNASDARREIENYLTHVRARLRGIDERAVREITDELHSHIVDKATVDGELTTPGVEQALAALGSPEDLAKEYVTHALLARAELSRSPVQIVQSLFRWASLSVAGFFVLLGAVGGYLIGGAFLLCAVLKPLHPATAGLWEIPSGVDDIELSLRLGFGSAPPVGREVLGWWIVPIGLLAGGGLLLLTTWIALWCIRWYRRSRSLPQAGLRLASMGGDE